MKSAAPLPASKNAACAAMLELIRPHLEGELSAEENTALQQHIFNCAACKKEFDVQARLISLLSKTFEANRVSETFDLSVNGRLQAQVNDPEPAAVLPFSPPRQRGGAGGGVARRAASPAPVLDDDEAELALAAAEPAAPATFERLGGAPWWAVSLALHVLIIALASLVSMAITLPHGDDAVIMVTELQPRPTLDQPQEEKKAADANDALSNHDTPPTDPNSKVASNIVVPPDILAKAELSDHFETINPDLPDTHSALGNPEAESFHSVTGNTDAAGGGGTGGLGMEDVIGVGGAASKGTGGGFGGGDGTGIGIGKGAGKGSFGQRNGGGRKLLVARHGGSAATESAVDKALHWLAYHQEADGHWDGAKYGASHPGDTALTGLATLAFLGAGHSEKIGGYKDNVKRAVAWMIAQQNAQGCVVKPGDGAPLGYNHAIASLALAEAAGMARIPETVAAAQKAVDYSVNVHQQGSGSDRLGWRYRPNEMGDISVVGWFVMQLKSAKIAGLHVDPLSFEGAMRYLDTVETEKPKAGDLYTGNHYGYRSDLAGGGIRIKNPWGNTAIGCLCREFMGVKADELQGGVEYFVEKGGVPRAEHPEFYYWYYGTLCAFQYGGDLWKKWNEGLKSALIPTQCKVGDNEGSWEPTGFSTSESEKCGGRVFTTAIGALCLEVYYRYMQLQAR